MLIATSIPLDLLNLPATLDVWPIDQQTARVNFLLAAESRGEPPTARALDSAALSLAAELGLPTALAESPALTPGECIIVRSPARWALIAINHERQSHDHH